MDKTVDERLKIASQEITLPEVRKNELSPSIGWLLRSRVYHRRPFQ
jgi:hypothetical protein